MKIILLATSQTQTCLPLTFNKPNALLKVFNKTLLEFAIDSVSAHCLDFKVLVLKKHFTLFEKIFLPDSASYEIIDNVSQIESITSGDETIIDVVNFHPKSDSTENVRFGFFPIKYSWDLLSCQENFFDMVRYLNQGHIETNAVVRGNVSIGKGTVIKSGAYIEGNIKIGDNCIIGPNCYIRGVCSIDNNCRIGNAVEIKNSIIGENVNVCHLSYVGDSIIGDDTNLGAGFINSNFRHDGAAIITKLNGEKINTHRQKLGVIIGEGVHTGVKTSTYPGRKIWPCIMTLPGEIVDKDIVS